MTENEKAEKLKALYEEIQSDPHYRNQRMGEVFVAGRGSLRDSGIVFIGEAPGEQEEKKRSPFVGPAGRNLNELLQGIGVSRDDVYVTNLVKYRPVTPKGENRAPTAREARNALPYLLRELEILSPQIVVCLGLSSAKAVLEDPNLKMGEANGAIFNSRGFEILVTYHPSPYNYKFSDKKLAMEEAFEHLQKICHSHF